VKEQKKCTTRILSLNALCVYNKTLPLFNGVLLLVSLWLVVAGDGRKIGGLAVDPYGDVGNGTYEYLKK
jgi:hypothetical protein